MSLKCSHHGRLKTGGPLIRNQEAYPRATASSPSGDLGRGVCTRHASLQSSVGGTPSQVACGRTIPWMMEGRSAASEPVHTYTNRQKGVRRSCNRMLMDMGPCSAYNLTFAASSVSLIIPRRIPVWDTIVALVAGPTTPQRSANTTNGGPPIRTQ